MLAVLVAAVMQASAPAVTVPAFGPEWVRKPGLSDLERYYPAAAAKEDLAGRVTLSCQVNARGRLTACAAQDVDPKGAGFEEAALKLADHFEMRPASDGGLPSGRVLRVPLFLRLHGDFGSGRINVRHPEVRGGLVNVDCRFRQSHLDNCLVRGSVEPKTAEVALKLATDVSLPPMPRPQGRIVLPIFFAFTPAPPAQSPDARPSVITSPDWRRRPTAQDLARVYPREAASRKIEGQATTRCGVSKEGLLVNCSTIDETPAFAGFGDAALKLMRLFLMRPATRDGVPVDGGEVRIPIVFRLP